MSVTRYDLLIVNRYAGDGTGEIETDAAMVAGPHGRYVSYEDYQRLESTAHDQAVTGDHNQIPSLEAEVAMLKKELTTTRPDALRYRILRQMHWHDGPLAVVSHPKASVKLGTFCPSGERLDEVLDEIAEQGATK